MYNILILGSGGREHTFAWKIVQSNKCNELYIAPGNAGTDRLGKNVSLDISDFEAVGQFCKDSDINMVFVGPEAPLVNGIADYFNNDNELKNILLIGPSRKAAQLEGSKAFANSFMQEFNIPTAASENFTKESLDEAKTYIRNKKGPYVLKADGLAAGKGVLIISDPEEACSELENMLSGKFGQAGDTVVIEDFMDGIEFSVFVITDGENYQILPVAKDYKRIGENDTGLNTGGMGSVSPVSFVNEKMMQKVIDRIVEPTMVGLKSRQMEYLGFIFIGLISVKGEPYVIEYNCRMGDPETEVVIPRLENDVVELFEAIASRSLDRVSISERPDYCTSVFLVSGGYPEKYEKGIEINGLDQVSDSLIFHAGTKKTDTRIVTNGGRVLALSSFGKTKKEALAKSMINAEKIEFRGKYYRKDIGFDIE